jgi:hypothetical protein
MYNLDVKRLGSQIIDDAMMSSRKDLASLVLR